MAYHLNLKTWSISPEPTSGSKPVPTAVVLPLVAILGATFLMFLPLIGFVLTGQALLRRFRLPRPPSVPVKATA